MSTTDEYCIACGHDGPLRIERKPTEFDIRGETLHFDVPVKVCPSCGTTETIWGADPAEFAWNEYRQRMDLPPTAKDVDVECVKFIMRVVIDEDPPCGYDPKKVARFRKQLERILSDDLRSESI